MLAALQPVATGSPAVSAVVEQELELPPNALVRKATFTVRAEAAGKSPVGQVSLIRSAGTMSVLIDFQGMRTVAGIDLTGMTTSPGIISVKPWVGTQFSPQPMAGSGKAVFTFTEVKTERLLVDLDKTVQLSEIAEKGFVSLPARPVELELWVNDLRAWSSLGPAVPGVPPAVGSSFVANVDLTSAVQAAVRTGVLPVRVSLRSSEPGRLALESTALDFLNVHEVFSNEEARLVELDSEGEHVVKLPLRGDEGAAWTISSVELTISGDLGASRTIPPTGPPLAVDVAFLVLDSDRGVAVQLPSYVTDGLTELTGIRLPLGVPASGGELSGFLRTSVGAEPGHLIPKSHFGPITVEGGNYDQPRWVTFPLTPPCKLVPGQAVWVDLQAARGTLFWPLAASGGDPRFRAPLRRQAPEGGFRQFSKVGGVNTEAEPAHGAIRVIGKIRPDFTLPPLRVALGSADIGIAPIRGGKVVTLNLEPEVEIEPGAGRSLDILLTAATTGKCTVESVRLAYSLGTDSRGLSPVAPAGDLERAI